MRHIHKFIRESHSEHEVSPGGGEPNGFTDELDDRAFCEYRQTGHLWDGVSEVRFIRIIELGVPAVTPLAQTHAVESMRAGCCNEASNRGIHSVKTDRTSR